MVSLIDFLVFCAEFPFDFCFFDLSVFVGEGSQKNRPNYFFKVKNTDEANQQPELSVLQSIFLCGSQFGSPTPNNPKFTVN